MTFKNEIKEAFVTIISCCSYEVLWYVIWWRNDNFYTLIPVQMSSLLLMDNNLRNFYRKHFKPENICLCLENILFMFLISDTIYCSSNNNFPLTILIHNLKKHLLLKIHFCRDQFSWNLCTLHLVCVIWNFEWNWLYKVSSIRTQQNISQQTWNFIHQSNYKLCWSRQIQVFTFFQIIYDNINQVYYVSKIVHTDTRSQVQQ